jgi:hypothetical protein
MKIAIDLDVARGALADLRKYIEEVGGCDHDVGICCCDVICTADNLQAE